MTLIHVICVAFHHRNGPIVEHVYPPFPELEGESTDNDIGVKLPMEWKELPFFCLPDGAHKNDEDFVWFHLPPVAQWPEYSKTSFFGISCYRQISSDQLINKTPDITRSTVQKAILVITQNPLFGSIREKLNIVTQTFFEQKDFSKIDILSEFYTNLNEQLSKPLTDAVLFNGTSLKTLVHTFRLKTLSLFKLFFLEKRIIFFGSKVETLCSFQYSLISLFPDLIRNLQNVAMPSLQFSPKHDENSKNKDKIERYGMPLSLFGKGCFFQPYIPLQQIDMLTSKDTTSYIIGTSNAIFLHNKECKPDVIINVDDFTIEYRNKDLEHIVSLTPADRKFIDEIIKIVDNSWDDDKNDILFDGSDPSIRSKFELYLYSLLYSIKLYTTSPSASSVQNQLAESGVTTNQDTEFQPITQEFIKKELLTDFNIDWLKVWMETKNYNVWDMTAGAGVLDVPIDGHPCKGSSAFDGVEISLRNTIKDLNIDKKMEPLKQGFNSVLTSAESTFANLVNSTKKKDVPGSSTTTTNKEENRKSMSANDLLENIQMKSSSFFNNVSSFIKRYQPAAPDTENEGAVANSAADVNMIAEPRKIKTVNEPIKE